MSETFSADFQLQVSETAKKVCWLQNIFIILKRKIKGVYHESMMLRQAICFPGI